MSEFGLEAAFEELARIGADQVNLAAHYHSIRTLTPRNGLTFGSYPGGCFFDPPSIQSESSPIDFSINDVPGMTDPLADIIQVANNYGVGVAAWTVCLHNTQLASENPDCRPVDAFGNEHTQGLCPSNDAVQRYLTDVVESISEYGVERIDLESIGFPSMLHGHGEGFGHLKNFGVTTDASRALISQCFCTACRESAAKFGIDPDLAAELVRDLSERVASPNESGESGVSSPTDLFERHSELRSLQTVRCRTITELVPKLAEASGTIPLNYYVADGLGRGVDDGLTAGIDLTELGSHLDLVTALYYSNDPAKLDGRVQRIRARTCLPTEVGVTVDPSQFDNRRRWLKAVDHALAENPARFNVYNYSLMTDRHVDWLRAAIQR